MHTGCSLVKNLCTLWNNAHPLSCVSETHFDELCGQYWWRVVHRLLQGPTCSQRRLVRYTKIREPHSLTKVISFDIEGQGQEFPDDLWCLDVEIKILFTDVCTFVLTSTLLQSITKNVCWMLCYWLPVVFDGVLPHHQRHVIGWAARKVKVILYLLSDSARMITSMQVYLYWCFKYIS